MPPTSKPQAFEIEVEGTVYEIDPASLMPEEMTALALDLAGYAIHTGTVPDDEVKAAAVAVQILRRFPRYEELELLDVVDATPVEVDPRFMNMTFEQQLAAIEEMVTNG